MYKALFFMENQLSLIENELNSLPPHEIIAHWVSGNKVNFLIKLTSPIVQVEPEKAKRGRPRKSELEVTDASA